MFELASLLEFGGSLTPLPYPVERQTGDFMGQGDLRQIAQYRRHHAPRIVVATSAECLRCREQALVESCGAGAGLTLHVGHHLRIEFSPTPTRRRISLGTLSGLFGHLAQRPLIDPRLALPRSRFCHNAFFTRATPSLYFLRTTLGIGEGATSGLITTRPNTITTRPSTTRTTSATRTRPSTISARPGTITRPCGAW